ncbi:1-deoxy-D-xylulose-5-phosphate synthase [Bacteroidales bacterium]|nr:1-deoxy-D-xylulose-5-phosphate synthase [Bacteroidales bacterium]
MKNNELPLLNNINSPDDLKKLDITQLVKLSAEIREYLIDFLCSNPGHFGASLGVVELTVALHYAYNMPEDKIIWDVGHQAYAHKLLTGRKGRFHTNRLFGGISGFPSMKESEYDSFGSGHSSVSISAALGIAVADHQHNKKNNQVVAVIGDGALTGGLAYEGLNNAGIENTNLLVILNDNNMAIDQNVGAMKEYLTDITTSKTYNRLKDDVWHLLTALRKIAPQARSAAQKIENALKSALLKQSNLFESLNFRYFGPVDGHDVVYLTKILKDLKDIKGPKLLHIITKKGKGFKPAENDQTKFHAPGVFNKETGEIIKAKSSQPKILKYQEIFGHTLVDLAEQNQKIIGITPAMPSGSSLNIMMKKIPNRAYDVGIAEQHAITFAAGLATRGMRPYVTIYSSFLQRAYDQIIHDVALQNLNVVFCIDRAGLVGSDGPTHHGAYDVAFMRAIPNITVAAPINDIDLRQMMYTAQLTDVGPFSIRYPRGAAENVNWQVDFEPMEIGKGRQLTEGNDVAVLSFGTAGNNVIKAIYELQSENISVAHYDMRFVKPLDLELLGEVCQKFDKIITIENGCIIGGFGSAVMEYACENKYAGEIKRMGIPDEYIEQGTPEELEKICGFDPEGIKITVKQMVDKTIFSNVS